MARILHLDLSHGVTCGGLLGACVDLGVAPSPLMHAAAAMPVELALRFESGNGGVRAIAEPVGTTPPEARRVDEVLAWIDRAEIPPGAREVARAAYRSLAAAGPRDGVPAYGGPDDSVLHVVAAAHALHELAPDRVTASPLDLGTGDPPAAVVELFGDHVEALTFDDPAKTPTTPLGAALVSALLPLADLGREAPAWTAHPLEGRGLRGDGGPLVVRLGNATEG